MSTTSTHATTTPVAIGTGRLLIAAASTGPVFFTVVLAQLALRDGFDLRVHPISQLATGAAGWIQTTNFVLAGVGMLALAIAHRRLVRDGIGRRVVPILIAIFGLGLVIAGLFPMDPQYGFPVGTPTGPAPAMSWHSVVHSTAAALAYTALAVACIVLVVRGVRRREVGAAIGNGLVALVLLLPMSPTESSLQIAANGVITFAWAGAYALRLRRRGA